MKGKVVVITGATSGIGEIAAQRLAEHGRAHRARGARRGARPKGSDPVAQHRLRLCRIRSITAIFRGFPNPSASRPKSPPPNRALMCSSTMPALCSAPAASPRIIWKRHSPPITWRTSYSRLG